MKYFLMILMFSALPLMGAEKELPKDQRAIDELAKKGDAQAQTHVGMTWINQRLPNFDKIGVKWLLKAAAQDYAEAHLQLHLLFDKGGKDIKKDPKQSLKWLSSAAKLGSTIAQAEFGFRLMSGESIEKNEEEAAKFFLLAAENGHVEAQYQIGRLYEKGEGVKKDVKKGLKWIEVSAKNGHLLGQSWLGHYLINGIYVDKNEKEAAFWFQKAADQGVAYAQARLGWMYAEGVGVEKNLNTSELWLEKSAKQGFAKAQVSLGLHLLTEEQGFGRTSPRTPNDILYQKETGAAWLLKAAKQNDPEGQYNYGRYLAGLGRVELKRDWRYDAAIKKLAWEPNYQEAKLWYKKSADQSYAPAQVEFANLYRKGLGVIPNPIFAMVWYRKAADQNDAQGQYMVGGCYYSGIGVEKDFSKAANWYRKAAEQGYAPAQFSLGWQYLEGLGVEQNAKIAFGLIKKSAEQNSDRAQYALGNLYFNGEGVEKNKEEGMKWYRKAAEQGLASAQFELGLKLETEYKKEKEAIEWYSKAAKQDHGWATQRIGYMYEFGYGLGQDYRKALEWYQKATRILVGDKKEENHRLIARVKDKEAKLMAKATEKREAELENSKKEFHSMISGWKSGQKIFETVKGVHLGMSLTEARKVMIKRGNKTQWIIDCTTELKEREIVELGSERMNVSENGLVKHKDLNPFNWGKFSKSHDRRVYLDVIGPDSCRISATVKNGQIDFIKIDKVKKVFRMENLTNKEASNAWFKHYKIDVGPFTKIKDSSKHRSQRLNSRVTPLLTWWEKTREYRNILNGFSVNFNYDSSDLENDSDSDLSLAIEFIGKKAANFD